MKLGTWFQWALVACMLNVSTGSAEDWPAWRGPRGDGTSLETGVPTRWGATDNIAWKVAIPGSGHASPIVSGNYVFITTCIEDKRERILLCLERATGRIVWQQVVFRAGLEAVHHLNSRASSTPASDGESVYVSFLEPDGVTVPAEVLRKRSGNLRADNSGKPVNPGVMCVAADRNSISFV